MRKIQATTARQSAQNRHIFAALSGSWVHHIVSGQLQQSFEHAAEFLRIAALTGDEAMTIASHFVSGSSLFHLGRIFVFSEALKRRMADASVVGPFGKGDFA